MPVPTTTNSELTQDGGKNIWIAAGEGNLERVKQLVDEQGVSPVAPDPFTYTPLHAAASYGHVDILRFLLSHASAPSDAANTTDEDKDTPLFVCESVEPARVLIEEFGADPKWKNDEGLTPAQQADENEHEELAAYLRGITGEAAPGDSPAEEEAEKEAEEEEQDPPQAQIADAADDAELDAQAEEQTDALMERVGQIMERAEAEGRDPEPELRRLVGDAVVRQVMESMDRAPNAL